MDDEGENIYGCLLGTTVKDPNLGIRYTTAKTRLDIHLVLLEACATSRSYEDRRNKKVS